MQTTQELINNGTIKPLSEDLRQMEKSILEESSRISRVEESMTDEAYLAETLNYIDNSGFGEEMKEEMRTKTEKIFRNGKNITTNLSEQIPEMFPF